MINLIVNKGVGRQEIVQIEDSGDYLDKESVVWDERVDGPLTADQMSKVGGFTRVDNHLVFSQEMFDQNVTQSAPSQTAIIASKFDDKADIYALAISALSEQLSDALNSLRATIGAQTIPFAMAKADFLQRVAAKMGS